MGTVIQDMPQINQGSQPRWDRFERADLFEQYRQLRTQGVSERQAAKELKAPRTTLKAWRLWHNPSIWSSDNIAVTGRQMAVAPDKSTPYTAVQDGAFYISPLGHYGPTRDNSRHFRLCLCQLFTKYTFHKEFCGD